MIDPIQKEAIVKLNQHGMAVAMIARLLGLEPSSVRSHLARNTNQRLVTKSVEDGRWCRWCGDPIATQATGRPESFCCSEHRRAWWTAHPEAKRRTATYTFTCIGCGTTFTAYGNKHRRYCRHECYVTHRNKKCPR